MTDCDEKRQEHYWGPWVATGLTEHRACTMPDCSVIDSRYATPVDPADWTPEQAQAAQAELDELERTDPDVAAAAASYDRMVKRVVSTTVAEQAAFLQLVRTLLISYRPQGVHIWLGSVNAHLDGLSPMGAWVNGDRARVQEVADLIEGGL